MIHDYLHQSVHGTHETGTGLRGSIVRGHSVGNYDDNFLEYGKGLTTTTDTLGDSGVSSIEESESFGRGCHRSSSHFVRKSKITENKVDKE